jgi:hypothetical protein
MAIMGLSILVAVLNIAGAIHLALRPNVSMTAGLVIFGIVAFQTLIYFILFRLGRGLVDSERSAVQGLSVLYVVGLAGAAYAIFSEFVLSGLAAMIVLTVAMLPPLVVAYWNWSDFRAAE